MTYVNQSKDGRKNFSSLAKRFIFPLLETEESYLFIYLFIYVCFFICLFSLSAGISQSIMRPATCYYGVRIPSEARDFSLLQTFRPFLVPIQPPVEWYRGIKWYRLEVNSLPSSADVKKQWSYTSIPPTYLHGVDRGIFIFLFYSSDYSVYVWMISE